MKSDRTKGAGSDPTRLTPAEIEALRQDKRDSIRLMNELLCRLTPKFDDAFQYAHQLHREQLRKGTSIPYISHLMTVAALVIEHGGDEEQAIAALLHDAAEDQGGASTLAEIRTRFGEDVAAIVSDCTDAWVEPKPDWRPRKEAYLARLPQKPARSLLVSLADKTHNAEAILLDYRALGDELWGRFNGGAEGTRWYYGALAAIYAEKMPGRLSDRLSRAVAGLTATIRSGPR
jgi:(p)ppGpp synthase/HD superfamily hydrolase